MEDLYLNHAGTSWPKPDVVSKAVRDAMAAAPADWPQRFELAHQAIAEFFGVNDRERILLTPGCTSALTVGIGDALLQEGQRVLTSRWEHHALHRPLLKLAATGIPVEYIPPEEVKQPQEHACPLDLDWLEQTLASRDVGLVAITAACNVTGELLPYEDVIRIAHRYGAMVLIDAAQIVGWVKLDLPRLGADMVAFGGHKGLQAPWGIGGLYLSDRARMECASARCELPVPGKPGDTALPRPGYCDVGSVDQYALAGLHAAIELLNQQDLEAQLTNARRQIRKLRSCLESFDRLRLFGPPDASRAMPSLAFADTEHSSVQLAARFKHWGLIVGSGMHCAPLAHQSLDTADSGLVRLSVGLGQPDEQIDEAIDRVRSALGEEIGSP